MFNTAFPSLNADRSERVAVSRPDVAIVFRVVLQGIAWLGESVDVLAPSYDARMWAPIVSVHSESKLCNINNLLLNPRLEDGTPYASLPPGGKAEHLRVLAGRLEQCSFRKKIAALWSSQAMELRRQGFAATRHVLDGDVERAAAAAAVGRERLQTCGSGGRGRMGSGGRGRMESCLGAFKRCAKCQVVRYCSPECQLADWKMHRKGCKAREKKGESPFN